MSQAPLDYQTPPPPSKNSRKNVFLRILAGTVAGGGSAAIGAYLYNGTNNPLLGWLPFLLTFGVALYVSLRFRRHGYAAGVILAPFIISGVLIILGLALCGVIMIAGSGLHR